MSARRPQVVCFDLDGPVMLRPNSLQYLLLLSRAPVETLREIDRREASGRVGWIAADHERAAWIEGLPVKAIDEHFDDHLETIANLGPVLKTLTSHGTVSVLITSGPVEVAEALGKRFAFDYCFGSTFEAVDGVYTGRIMRHLGSDGESDVALFKAVGVSIGINCAETAARFAHHSLQGNDLAVILPFVLQEPRSLDSDRRPAFP